jgi:hypothetical protein
MDKNDLNRDLALMMVETILTKDNNNALDIANRWDNQVIIDDIDYGVMKLVPLYYQKLKDIAHQSKYENRLKVLYKYWWLKILKNLDRLKEVLMLLKLSDIQVMLIKGVPILPYYAAPVYRPMADLDILVKKESVLKTMELLSEQGWKPTDLSFYQDLKKSTNLCMDFNHSIELEHIQEKTKMDLHWKVGNYSSWELTDRVWKNSIQSTQFSGERQPNLPDLLAMTLLHSTDSESKHHYNWILDVAMMESVLLPNVWEQAMEQASMESKKGWFHYGCHVLSNFGLKTPFSSLNKKPPQGRLRKEEFGNRIIFPRYIWKKIKNTLIIIDINFPHDRGLKKIKTIFRRIAYFKLNRVS